MPFGLPARGCYPLLNLKKSVKRYLLKSGEINSHTYLEIGKLPADGLWRGAHSY